MLYITSFQLNYVKKIQTYLMIYKKKAKIILFFEYKYKYKIEYFLTPLHPLAMNIKEYMDH